MNIEKELFGKNEDGKEIYKYNVKGENISATFCETGAAIMSIFIKDKDDEVKDVVLGLETYEQYRKNWLSFGAVIGRCANRISGAKFTLNNTTYKLKKNITGGCLHSGFSYHYRDFESESFTEDDSAHIIFKLESPDGDQGFPGNLKVKVEYVVKEDKSVTIKYSYISDSDTVVNMTNHCYFNLDGHNSGSVLNHKVMINSDEVTQVDRKLMPTGKIMKVDGSAYDFRKMTKIADNMRKSFKPYSYEKAYDINYVLSDHFGEYKLVAKLESEKSEIGMNVYTNMPGMQFYTGNAAKGFKAKGDAEYAANPGVCFETQFYPDAINIEKFPSPVVKAGVFMSTETKYEFYDLRGKAIE
ncbi:aldose epimerase family protein [Bovifimicola ammoniilytica]|uniref:aldose epimerase family protein n=1 Tax=Bovifimicola ammoniilytica TaxID=2981720 RepID=UPI000822F732|nr:aldose epimerase family protein [Bovifimicola ammoniilytica]MCU6752511.1 galactose mutarotase [Bovifimicola ammoniilytica]SCJ27472.1 Aldose 1-epimerase [uncultured Eubacterium sp.]